MIGSEAFLGQYGDAIADTADTVAAFTAGLSAIHNMEPWHGIDIQYLSDGHHRHRPTVARLRETAAMLGHDIWITVKLPGEYGGDDDLEETVPSSAGRPPWSFISTS